MGDNKVPKSSKIYYCESCDFKCSRKSQFDRHLMTLKHQNGYKMVTNGDNKVPKSSIYVCECGNTYKHRQGLSRHKKNCYTNEVDTIDKISNISNIPNIPNISNDNQGDFKELILLLLKDNKEIQKNFMDMLPYIKGNAENSYNNTNSHNTNNFNIQMFLNEHCKNAMNLTDFIDTLPLTAETYNNTLENGLTKSITTMITNGLNNIDILERPIHCTDPARKTMYIKDNDVWEKDTELNLLLENITLLATKHRININKWQDANTGWDKNENLQTKMTTLVFNSMTSIEEDEKEINKIVRAISKNTYLSTDIKNEFK